MKPVLHIEGRNATNGGGFTLLEVLIAFTLVVILLFNATQLINTASKAGDHTAKQQELDQLADQVIDRIALALMAANEERTLPANSAPFNSDLINYETSLGVEDGETVWSEPERIALDTQDSMVSWYRNPETPDVFKLVWGKHVSEMQIDELGGNNADDNGNVLIDEKGLSFNIDRSSVQINLTLRQVLTDGTEISASTKTRVAFRN
ncbi:hypothetical protein Pla163_04710 [Planctomycetes bacterium Pla163]|uniref:Prepilin-type N-terminal cleavage/methylation domain-containing protein n=1 Tax=Rohdeia mirabilis TaxID=2528008 RepID=A0A518CVW5_9BACT|nr:hypothetical protein Pla163_04710 [Planctomycetes bacterium Pla163]